MKFFIVIFLFLSAAAFMAGQDKTDSLFSRLDEALSQKQQFENKKQAKIEILKQQYFSSKTGDLVRQLSGIS